MAGKVQIPSPARAKLKIASEITLGRNANIVCRANEELITQIKECITNEFVEIGIVNRDKKSTKKDPYAYLGINADSVNAAIRNRLKNIDKLSFETNVEYGGFFERNIKSNFDFSFYDRIYNYCSFWNHNCKDANLEQIIDKTIQEKDKADWIVFMDKYNPQPGILVEYTGQMDCNVVGEIQMGNWALIYKDIFRLLRAKNSPGVHLYIYITNTGLLEKKLSDGVVTYDKAVAELRDNIDVIDVPILILGIDIEEYNESEFFDAHGKTVRLNELIKKKKLTVPQIKGYLAEGYSIDEIENFADNTEEE